MLSGYRIAFGDFIPDICFSVYETFIMHWSGIIQFSSAVVRSWKISFMSALNGVKAEVI